MNIGDINVQKLRGRIIQEELSRANVFLLQSNPIGNYTLARETFLPSCIGQS